MVRRQLKQWESNGKPRTTPGRRRKRRRNHRRRIKQIHFKDEEVVAKISKQHDKDKIKKP